MCLQRKIKLLLFQNRPYTLYAMRLSLLLLVSSLFLLSSCRHTSTNAKARKLVFGTYYGMCFGNCVNIYQLTETSLAKDDSAKYNTLSWTYNFTTTQVLDVSKFNKAKDLLNQVPSEMLVNNNKTYGCPDCHDQGGIFVMIENGSAIIRLSLDRDNTSDQSVEVIAFKDKLIAVIDQLK